MASTSSRKPSSFSTSIPPSSYDAFLSFRGEDTRRNFTGHLYHALVTNGINTFKDDEELETGGVIAEALIQAIEESKVFFVIFSKNCAYSKWCLNELVKIIECMKAKQRRVVPIFYDVDPSEVRRQSGGGMEKRLLITKKMPTKKRRRRFKSGGWPSQKQAI